MNVEDVEKLLATASRFIGKLEDRAGPGTSWTYTHPDGSKTTTEITKVKEPEELDALFFALAVAVWSIKDYLRGIAPTLGTTPNAIEQYANADPDLPMCADIANLMKHGELTRSRSEKWPVSAKLRYTITFRPQSGEPAPVDSLFFGEDGLVRIDVSDPALVEIRFDVKNDDGVVLCDGLECLASGMSSWEALYQSLTQSPAPDGTPI